MKNVLRLTALTVTAYLLVATSRAPCSNSAPGSQTFTVSGTCGPSGTITVTSDTSCVLTVDGGEAVFLPAFGEQSASGPILGQAVTLNGWVTSLDGGAVPLSDGGERAPASMGETGACAGAGCPRGNYRTCSTSVVDDGGVLTLRCSTDMDVCTDTLTPVP